MQITFWRCLQHLSTGAIGLSALLLSFAAISEDDLKTKRQSTLSHIEKLEQQLKNDEIQLASLHQAKQKHQRQAHQVSQKQQALTEQYQDALKRQEKYATQLAKLLAWQYKDSNQRPPFAHWLTDIPSLERDRFLQYSKYVNEQYQNQLNTLKKWVAHTRHLHEQLQHTQTEQAELTQNQTALLEKTQQQQTLRQSTLKKLRAQLKQLDKKQAQQRHQKQQRQAEEKLKQQTPPQTQTSHALSFVKQKGRLPWPISEKSHRRFHDRNAWVFNGTSGEPVQAIADGTIVFADWLSGYGLLIAIDHGQNHMSFYGYNQSLAKRLGQNVLQGETLAFVGQSGGQNQPSLYFEIRHKGKAQDPKHWLQ